MTTKSRAKEQNVAKHRSGVTRASKATKDEIQSHHVPERGRVQVIEAVNGEPNLLGRRGVALAGGPDASGSWSYTVLIDVLNETYHLPESALAYLGWTVAESMYGPAAFKVRVDSRGNGRFLPPMKKQKRA